MTERYINPRITRLFEQAEIAKFDPEEVKLYEDSMNAYRDIVNAINTARKDSFAEGEAKGRAEGREEGRAEGREEGRKEGIKEAQRKTAMTLLRMGIPIPHIAQATGMTLSEIEQLR